MKLKAFELASEMQQTDESSNSNCHLPFTSMPLNSFLETTPTWRENMLPVPESSVREPSSFVKLADCLFGNPSGWSPSATASPFSARLGVFVVPQQLFNFTHQLITLKIHVFNLPTGCRLAWNMFSIMVTAPSGRQIESYLKVGSLGSNTASFEDEFTKFENVTAAFIATDEVGIYSFRVRVVIPLQHCFKWTRVHQIDDIFGVAGDVSEVFVCRNYLDASESSADNAIQMSLLKPRRPDAQIQLTDTSWLAWGLACDTHTDRFYVTERYANRVSCLDHQGKVLFRLKQNRYGQRLQRPSGICLDNYRHRVILCDKDNNRVCFYSMYDGSFLSSFGGLGHEDGQFSYPWDVAINPFGNRIVVTDSRNKRIQMFNEHGKFIDKFCYFEPGPYGNTTVLGFRNPRGIAFDRDGKLIYVTDYASSNIMEVPISFEQGRKVLPVRTLKRPQGIAVDQMGCLLVADSRKSCVYQFYNKGERLSSIYRVGSERLEYPLNIAMMSGGKMAVLHAQGRIEII